MTDEQAEIARCVRQMEAAIVAWAALVDEAAREIARRVAQLPSLLNGGDR